MAGMFANITGMGGPGAPPVGGWNGATGFVAVGDKTEHIKPKNKLIINPNGDILLEETLANTALRITDQSPLPAGGGGVPVTVNAASFDTVKRAWSDVLGIYEVYRLLHAAGVALGWRLSDVIQVATFTAHWNGQEANWIIFAQQMLAFFALTPGTMREFAAGAHFCALNMVRACHHRHFTEGHNGYTEATAQRGSRSNKICGIAGALKDAFVTWLSVDERIHDHFHALTDGSLEAAVNAATGTAAAPTMLPAGTMVDGTVIAAPIPLKDAFRLGQACLDRHPPGALGLSGAILVCEAIQVFMLNMSLRFGAGPTVSATLVAILTNLRCSELQAMLDRTAIAAITEAITPIGSWVVGFISCNTASKEWVDSHASLSGLTKRDNQHYLSGNQLGREVAQIAVIGANLVTAINGFMASLDQGLTTVANQLNTALGGIVGPAPAAIAALPPMPAHAMANWV